MQIFASDISEQAIEKARAGRYLENIAADMSAERLNRYFTKMEGRYQINKDLREMCVFTRHNLLTDPPFSKLDLVSCRNVLIYLASVQKNIIPLFHYALQAKRFSDVGRIGNGGVSRAVFGDGPRAPDLCQAGNRARSRIRFARGSGAAFGGAAAGKKAAGPAAEVWDGVDVRQEVDRILLSRYSPAGVVVDEELEVLEIRGKANAFLCAAGGQGELQSAQTDPGDQSVPGSGKAGPPGADTPASRRGRSAFRSIATGAQAR